MSDTLVVAQTSTNQAVVTVLGENVVAETTATQAVVTSLGSQGVQGIQGLTGPQGIQGIQGIQGPTATVSTASDVDISTIKTGSLLIYNQSTEKWVSTDVLAAQYVDSGQY